MPGAIINLMLKEVNSESDMKLLGESLGRLLCGGEVIELVGDVGSGKTTFVKGLAVGLGIDDYVQSPSFTISRVYQGRDDLNLTHYDFYRLNDAGIMANDLSEGLGDPKVITVIEWGGVVNGVLPDDRLTVNITSTGENSRKLLISSGGQVSAALVGGL
jgi:tRNA threonylcarbamoyladenosine biosynthesis protein TsaE